MGFLNGGFAAPDLNAPSVDKATLDQGTTQNIYTIGETGAHDSGSASGQIIPGSYDNSTIANQLRGNAPANAPHYNNEASLGMSSGMAGALQAKAQRGYSNELSNLGRQSNLASYQIGSQMLQQNQKNLEAIDKYNMDAARAQTQADIQSQQTRNAMVSSLMMGGGNISGGLVGGAYSQDEGTGPSQPTSATAEQGSWT